MDREGLVEAHIWFRGCVSCIRTCASSLGLSPIFSALSTLMGLRMPWDPLSTRSPIITSSLASVLRPAQDVR
jgi:hypothetical protein